MARYATGKKSKAISDISGAEVPYKYLRTNWKGQRVSPEDFDPKQPQLTPRKNIIDAVVLKNPRYDNDPENIIFYVGFSYDIFAPRNQVPNVGISSTGGVGITSVSIE